MALTPDVITDSHLNPDVIIDSHFNPDVIIDFFPRLVEFFRYYAWHFDFAAFVVRARDGGLEFGDCTTTDSKTTAAACSSALHPAPYPECTRIRVKIGPILYLASVSSTVPESRSGVSELPSSVARGAGRSPLVPQEQSPSSRTECPVPPSVQRALEEKRTPKGRRSATLQPNGERSSGGRGEGG